MAKTLSRVKRTMPGQKLEAFLVTDSRGRRSYYSTDGMMLANAGDVEWETVRELGEFDTVEDFAAMTGTSPEVFFDDCRRCGKTTLLYVSEDDGLCRNCRWDIPEETAPIDYIN